MTKNANYLDLLENNLPYQIEYTANFNKSFRREFQARFIGDEVTPDEFSILYAITNVPDISQSEIATLLFKGKAHVGKILNDMETRGIIKRIADTKNNIMIKKNILTDKGKAIFAKGDVEINKVRNLVEREFTPQELDKFIYYLKKYRQIQSYIVDVKLK